MGLPVLGGRILGGGPPRRLLLSVAAVAAIVGVVFVVRPGLDHRSARPGPVVPTVDIRTTDPAGGEDSGGLYTPTIRPSARALATEVATGFVTAWARPSLPPERWWDGVARYAEPGYARLLRTVDPVTVPATRVTGSARVVTAEPGLLVVDVPADTGTCRVTVADASGTGVWKVTTHSWIPRDRP